MSEEAFPGARQESDGHAALRSDLPSQKSEPSADFRKIVSDYFDSNGFLLKDNLEKLGLLRIPGDGDQRFPNDRDRDSWMIVISVPTEGDQ